MIKHAAACAAGPGRGTPARYTSSYTLIFRERRSLNVRSITSAQRRPCASDVSWSNERQSTNRVLKEDVVTRVERGMLWWFGHRERMNENRPTKQMYRAKVCDGKEQFRVQAGAAAGTTDFQQIRSGRIRIVVPPQVSRLPRPASGQRGGLKVRFLRYAIKILGGCTSLGSRAITTVYSDSDSCEIFIGVSRQENGLECRDGKRHCAVTPRYPHCAAALDSFGCTPTICANTTHFYPNFTLNLTNI
ncbi:hypothetical protein EVAR_61832_1 [Eumeta japonica]|uniref:Uncharacterized protein n=1 Tax=Eumeta variegata TaxID=151549 RepID=A0A4C1YYB5_EUMVA|nr:hypothetical protein EVAR_61832_1 [Eumeta japonica]